MNTEPAPKRAPVWVAASGRGALAFGVVFLLAQGMALLDSVSLNTPGGLSSTLRLGTLYVSAFHRGALTLQTELAGQKISLRASGALMLGTTLALWLLFKGGGSVAGRGGALERGFRGTLVVPAYALLCLAAAAVTAISPLHVGSATVQASVPSALLWPLGLGCLAGFAGGAMTVPTALKEGGARRLAGPLVGGWSMFAYGMVAAFLALMLLAALRPEYSRLYLAGFRSVRQGGGAAGLAHNALLLPNESTWAMAASMGACDGIYGSVNVDVLCYSHFPTGFSDTLLVPQAPQAPAPSTTPRIPRVLLIFALVPPVAVLLGGAAGERIASSRSYREAARIGAGSGFVFAFVMALAALFCGLALRLSGAVSMAGTSLYLGPNIRGSALVALAWGVPGGAIGAMLGRRFGRSREYPAAALRLREDVDEVGEPADKADPSDDDAG